jgi:hypothetical protein
MKEVKVRKDELRTIVQVNRDSHRTVFEKALEVYRSRMIDYLEHMMDDIKHGRKVEHFIRMPEPEDHTDDYDRVLKMIDMSVDDEMVIGSSEFAQYVMDDWKWKESFANNTGSYLAS